MTDIFLERSFDVPLTPADVQSMAEQSSQCFGLYRVGWTESFLSADGQQMICWFAAPDAESGRGALRQAGAEIDRLWPGTVHDSPDPEAPTMAEANVLVSRSFAEPVTLEDIQAIEDAGAWCLETHGVKFARTFFSLDRKRMVCLYQAPDAEAVRMAQRQAEMPVDQIWAFKPVKESAQK